MLLALAHCQLGDVDQAVAAIEQVDIDDFPFGLAARALVRAVAGDTDGAAPTPRRSSGRAGPATSTSPLGRLAGVLACRRAGDEAGSEALARPAQHAGVVGRRRRVHHHRPAAPRPPGRRRRRRQSPPLAPGWRRIVDSVVVG